MIGLLIILFPLVLMAGEVELTLDRAIRTALERHIESVKSQLELEKIEDQIKEVRAGIFPTLRLSATYTRWDPNYISAFVPENQYFINFNLNQTLFDRSVFMALKVAKRTRDLQKAVIEDVKRSLEAEVKKLYWGVLLQREVLRVREESLRYWEGYFELVREKYEKGIVPRFEFLRARAQLKGARANLIRARSDYRRALNSLRSFLGIEGKVVVKGSLDPVKFTVEDPDRLLLRNNSTLQVLRKTLRARESAVEVKKAEFYPRLSAFANYDIRNIIDFRAGQLVEDQRRGYSYGLRLDFTIFEGLARTARVSQERLELEKVRKELEFTKGRLLADLDSLLTELESSEEELSASLDTLESEREALRFAEERYREGVGSQLDLLNARLSYERALINYYSAVLRHNSIVADIERLIR